MQIRWRRHRGFMASLLAGVLTGLCLFPLDVVDRLMIGADVMFALYLILMARTSRALDADSLRKRSAETDESMKIIVPIAVAAILISLYAIQQSLGAAHQGVLRPLLALASVPLGWAMLHTLMAFHYAALWYARGDDGNDARGLQFAGNPDEVGISDFIYYSYTLGMTAQTSDTAVSTQNLRRTTTVHAMISFFYNTVLLAIAVNAAVALGQ